MRRTVSVWSLTFCPTPRISLVCSLASCSPAFHWFARLTLPSRFVFRLFDGFLCSSFRRAQHCAYNCRFPLPAVLHLCSGFLSHFLCPCVHRAILQMFARFQLFLLSFALCCHSLCIALVRALDHTRLQPLTYPLALFLRQDFAHGAIQDLLFPSFPSRKPLVALPYFLQSQKTGNKED